MVEDTAPQPPPLPRSDATRADDSLERRVILFDGVCGFCQASVRFILKRDRGGTLRFASLQSHAAERILGDRGPALLGEDTILFVEPRGRVSTRSTAALRIARALRFPWNLAIVFFVVPRPLRDWAYDLFARNRYRWFERLDACPVPPADVRERFLDS